LGTLYFELIRKY